MAKYDIFVSYSWEEKNIVQPFCEILKENGYKVWIDLQRISGGHEIPEEISNAIKESHMLLFFSSFNSNSSKWVKREVIFADNQNKPILPICLDESEYNPSLLLLLAGVEYIDARSGIELVKKNILTAIAREIGKRTEVNKCPITDSPCPEEKIIVKDSATQRITDNANNTMVMRHALRSEAFVFAFFCETIWVLLIGCPLIFCGFISSTYGILIASAVAFFGAIYGTNLSTLSIYVPGWYNRHLTTYGALILTLEAYITLFAFSLPGFVLMFDICHAAYLTYSLLGILSMIMIFRLKKIGYYLLWLDGIMMSATSYMFLPHKYNISVPIVLLCVYVFLMAILKATLHLHCNRTSTWALLFNKKVDFESQNPSKIEHFLMKIWRTIYRV